MGILEEIKNNIDDLIEAMKTYVLKFNKDNINKRVERMSILEDMTYHNKKLTEFFNQTNSPKRRGGLATKARSLVSSAKEQVSLQGVALFKIDVKKIKSRTLTIKKYTQNNNKGHGWNGYQKFLLTEINKIKLLVNMLNRGEIRVEQARRNRGVVDDNSLKKTPLWPHQKCTESKDSKEERDKNIVTAHTLNRIHRRNTGRKQLFDGQRQYSSYLNNQEQPLIERQQYMQSSSCLSSCCLCLFGNKAPTTKGYHQMDDVVGDANRIYNTSLHDQALW